MCRDPTIFGHLFNALRCGGNSSLSACQRSLLDCFHIMYHCFIVSEGRLAAIYIHVHFRSFSDGKCKHTFSLKLKGFGAAWPLAHGNSLAMADWHLKIPSPRSDSEGNTIPFVIISSNVSTACPGWCVREWQSTWLNFTCPREQMPSVLDTTWLVTWLVSLFQVSSKLCLTQWLCTFCHHPHEL